MLKIVKFDGTNVKEEMEEFQKKYEIEFPRMYQNFLLNYNGGYTPETTFKIGAESSDIRGFFGFSSAPQEYRISNLEKFDIFDYILEQGYFPIAKDSFGDFLVIGLGQSGGSIYFFDFESFKFSFLSENLVDFFREVESRKLVIRTVEQRIQGVKDSGSEIEVDADLISLWQEEIDKYSGIKQENVVLDIL